LAKNAAFYQAATEVALIATANEPGMLMEYPTYNKLSLESKEAANNFPTRDDRPAIFSFFAALYTLDVLRRQDFTPGEPTPTEPVFVGKLGKLLVDEHFTKMLA
jgi:hypothetical protein